MAIVAVARNHVPVQVGHGVAQARQVDLARLEQVAESRLGCEYRVS